MEILLNAKANDNAETPGMSIKWEIFEGFNAYNASKLYGMYERTLTIYVYWKGKYHYADY